MTLPVIIVIFMILYLESYTVHTMSRGNVRQRQGACRVHAMCLALPLGALGTCYALCACMLRAQFVRHAVRVFQGAVHRTHAVLLHVVLPIYVDPTYTPSRDVHSVQS